MTDTLRNLQWREIASLEKRAFREGLAWGAFGMGIIAITVTLL